MKVALKLGTGILTGALVAGLGGGAVAGAQVAGTPPSPGGPQEGIKIHGRWTVEVRNPDGSVASRHEFNNALVPTSGERVLAGLLGRFYRHIQRWQIFLETPETGVCAAQLPEFASCPIAEHTGAGPAPMGTLSVIVPTFVVGGGETIPDQGIVELRGMTQFTAQGTIQRVATNLNLCLDTACQSAPPSFYQFTSHVLAAPIPVAANQVVQVTVVFSFS